MTFSNFKQSGKLLHSAGIIKMLCMHMELKQLYFGRQQNIYEMKFIIYLDSFKNQSND